MYEPQEDFDHPGGGGGGGGGSGGGGGGGGATGGGGANVDAWRNSYYTRLQMNAFSPVVSDREVLLIHKSILNSAERCKASLTDLFIYVLLCTWVWFLVEYAYLFLKLDTFITGTIPY